MMTSNSDRKTAEPSARATFSLVAGGVFHDLMRATRLSGPSLEGLERRIAAAILVAWVPLLILSVIDGTAWSGPAIRFLGDADAQVRLLVTLPLLLIAEYRLHQPFEYQLGKFLDRGLIAPEQRVRFAAAVESAMRLRNLPAAELAIATLVLGVAITGLWRHMPVLPLSGWFGQNTNGYLTPSLAGWWFGLVSLPLFWFLLLRWYFRLVVWWRFLGHVSRLDLQLEPLHPDHAGGLGFLAQTSLSFAPFLVAQGTQAAGWIANQVLYTGAPLHTFRLELAAVTVIAVLFVIAPLGVFTPKMSEARGAALGAYGNLAMRYAKDFDRKWLRGEPAPQEPLVGNADIQSLADLGNSYAALKSMRIVAIDSASALRLAIAVLAPCVFLLPTWISAEDFISKVVKMLM